MSKKDIDVRVEKAGQVVVALFKEFLGIQALSPKPGPLKDNARSFFQWLNTGFHAEYDNFDLGDICDLARNTVLAVNQTDAGDLEVEMAHVRPLDMAPFLPAVAGAVYQNLTEGCGAQKCIAEDFVKASLNEAALNVELLTDGISISGEDEDEDGEEDQDV